MFDTLVAKMRSVGKLESISVSVSINFPSVCRTHKGIKRQSYPVLASNASPIQK